MEFCGGDAEVFEFFIADCDSGFVLSLIQRGANGESLLRGGVGDQVYDDFVTGERASAPIFGNEAE